MDDQPLNEIMSQLDDIIWTDEEAVEAVSKEEFTRLVEEALIDVARPQLLQIISRFAWCHRPEHVAPRWVPERSSIPQSNLWVIRDTWGRDHVKTGFRSLHDASMAALDHNTPGEPKTRRQGRALWRTFEMSDIETQTEDASVVEVKFKRVIIKDSEGTAFVDQVSRRLPDDDPAECIRVECVADDCETCGLPMARCTCTCAMVTW